MNRGQLPTKKVVWVNLIFFLVTTLGALIGIPLYVARFGVSASELWLCLFFIVVTGLSITVGYHRLFAHATYKAHPVVQFFTLFFGAAAFEQSALKWSSQHRDHHRFVDTEYDPYSIKKGFFYAHMGWLIFWDHTYDFGNVRELTENKMLMHQHRYYYLWALGAGIVTPVLLGALMGHALGALIFSVCARLTFVYHGTFCINSVCHMFGKSTYDIYATAKDHWLVAFITYGEGYHNFHHRFPSDYRNGVRWYQWDPSKWTIAFLEKVGLVWDLKRVSAFRILEARLAGENQRTYDELEQFGNYPSVTHALESLKVRYERVRQNLYGWEKAVRDYRVGAQQRVVRGSNRIGIRALRKARKARDEFERAHHQWVNLIKQKPLNLQRLLLTSSLN